MIISKSRNRSDTWEGGRNIRALFVEDDRVDQMALRRSFEAEDPNFRFTIAGSVREAKQKIAGEKYDIVVIDFMLGDGTAFDVLGDLGNTPSIVVTGQGSVEIALEALKAGASDYLIKEPNHSHLLTLADTIRDTIRSHQIEEKAQMLSDAMDFIHDGIHITDMNGKVLYVNSAFQSLYGLSEAQILGQDENVLKEKSKKPVRCSTMRIKGRGTQGGYNITVSADVKGRNGLGEEGKP